MAREMTRHLVQRVHSTGSLLIGQYETSDGTVHGPIQLTSDAPIEVPNRELALYISTAYEGVRYQPQYYTVEDETETEDEVEETKPARRTRKAAQA